MTEAEILALPEANGDPGMETREVDGKPMRFPVPFKGPVGAIWQDEDEPHYRVAGGEKWCVGTIDGVLCRSRYRGSF